MRMWKRHNSNQRGAKPLQTNEDVLDGDYLDNHDNDHHDDYYDDHYDEHRDDFDVQEAMKMLYGKLYNID